MNDFIIVTDSALDMTAQLVEDLGVTVLPLTYTIQGKDYKNWPDHREMELRQFYQLMRDGEVATTSAINVHEYKECLTPILESGKDVLLMVFDAAISTATFQAATLAVEDLRAQFPQRKLLLQDTRCVTAGLYLMLLYAANLQKQGKGIEEVWQWCEDHKYEICQCFTVEDLKYLRRGGRISAATAVVGGMLNIKPLLHVGHDGSLSSIGKARGRNVALKNLVDLVKKHITNRDVAAITQADCPEDAEKVAQDLKTQVGIKQVIIGELGPVIGAHTGPGMLFVSFFGTERAE